MLIREIDYILDNVGKFVDQSQTVIVDNIQISGQVRIKISLSEFKISIFNNTKERIEDIRKRAKQRYQKEVLKILGVKFEYFCNEKENLAFLSDAVVTQITIPNIQNVKEN